MGPLHDTPSLAVEYKRTIGRSDSLVPLSTPVTTNAIPLSPMLLVAAWVSALLACTVSAAPRSSRASSLEDRLLSRQSGPRRPGNSEVSAHKSANHGSAVEYSSNWAGAVFESPANTYRSVTGTFVVPTPKVPAGSPTNGTYSGSIWVGIDGDTCSSAILQTGIDFTITNGRASYDAWYEYYPAYAYDFLGISIAAGNTIKLTATALSTTSGTVTIQNLSNKQTMTRPLVSTAKLCLQNVEWIVEDYQENGSQVPFASFSPAVTFTNAVATLKSGKTVGPSGSVLIEMVQNNQVVTSVSTGASSVTVAHL
uniref:Acid protease n=1 Tax=Mycena chlorophos TaxID=658473 RepID=A0ABQ0LP92_MYCCL|nr:predicted protein [Mycena chlorophos]